MEASKMASLRGHRVALFEQNSRLGGALLFASITNWRLGPVLKYMKREIRKLPIEVKLNTRLTPQLVEKMKPDVVVVAVGGEFPVWEAPGQANDIILSRNDIQAILAGHPIKKAGLGKKVVSLLAGLLIKYFYSPSVLRSLLKFNFPFKKRVVILGGNYAGCELAETLANRGKEVTIIEESGRVGSDIGTTHRWVFMRNLKDAGVKTITNAKLLEITNRGVRISHTGSQEFIEADTLVKVGVAINTKLSHELEGKVPVLYCVGDCNEQGLLMEAITSGFLAGEKVGS